MGIATGHADDFWELPEDTQAMLIARFRVRGTIEAYEDELNKKKKPKERKPGGRVR